MSLQWRRQGCHSTHSALRSEHCCCCPHRFCDLNELFLVTCLLFLGACWLLYHHQHAPDQIDLCRRDCQW